MSVTVAEPVLVAVKPSSSTAVAVTVSVWEAPPAPMKVPVNWQV